jgi:hypothetical protein
MNSLDIIRKCRHKHMSIYKIEIKCNKNTRTSRVELLIRRRNCSFKQIQLNGNFLQIFQKQSKNCNLIREKPSNICYQMKLSKCKNWGRCLHLWTINWLMKWIRWLIFELEFMLRNLLEWDRCALWRQLSSIISWLISCRYWLRCRVRRQDRCAIGDRVCLLILGMINSLAWNQNEK